MLGQQRILQSDQEITQNVMTLLQTWDPRVRTRSRLDLVGNIVLVSGGGLYRDKSNPPGSFMFSTEKDILINALEALIGLIKRRTNEIVGAPHDSLKAYYNRNNALQGLILLTTTFHAKFKKLLATLEKAERTARRKRSFKHLVSADFQNLTLFTFLHELDELIITLRQTQLRTLTEHGVNGNLIPDVLDHPAFMLAEGLEAYIPFKNHDLRDFLLKSWKNPLENTLRMTVSLGSNVRLLTMCPSWHHHYDEESVLEGPSQFFLSHHQQSASGRITYQPVNLSVLMNFNEFDTAANVAPFVHIALEIAQIHGFDEVIFHAPTGCANILYALGFTVSDDLEPTCEQQAIEVKARFERAEPIIYDARHPMDHIDSLDESFISETVKLRHFTLKLHTLSERPIYLNQAQEGMPPQATTWNTLLARRRYIDPQHNLGVFPDFLYLPMVQYTPTFRELRAREVTGRLPLSRMLYQSTPPDAADFNVIQTLQSIGAIHGAVLDDEDNDDIEELGMCVRKLSI
ncbi:MAG: hypothetical protein JSR17_10270 [Proteobacteria bacterium]|nr:hypothetical protein [Pseudomonadota bacterium]